MRLIGLAAVGLWLAAAVAPRPAAAQEDSLELQAPAGAPVVIQGDTLFVVTTRLGPFSAADRATAIAGRLERILADQAKAHDSVVVRDEGNETAIAVGDLLIATVTEADAQAVGRPRQELAAQYAAAIRRGLERDSFLEILREALTGLLFTLIATGVLAAAFWLLGRIFPAAYARLEAWRGTRIPSVRIQRLELLSANQVTETLKLLVRIVRIAVTAALIFYFVPLVLGFFPWTRSLSTTLFEYILDPLRDAWNALVAFLPDLFAIAVIAAVTLYALKFIHLIFEGIRRGSIAFPGFYPDWADPSYKIVRFLVLVFAVVVIWPYLPGSDTAAFRGISVFLGVLITFGSSSAIANVVAGVVMTYMRPFKIGDRVKIADTVGDVIEKSLLVTRVRTVKRVDVTIPNSMVLSSHIVNYSSTAAEGGIILHTTVTIGYDEPWQKIHELLLAAARTVEGTVSRPEPFVLQTSLDDSYVSYELNVYTDQPNRMAQLYSALHQAIQDRFAEAGVEITSPHYRAVRGANRSTVPPRNAPPTGDAAEPHPPAESP